MCIETFTIRGYNVKSLNLLVDSKTDAINFLGYAVDSAVRGDITEMESRVKMISDIFFPSGSKGGGNDPFWNNSASSVFKRTVYCLIDYYAEEVQAIREDHNLSNAKILQYTDEAWGHVTLYNAYKFVVELAAKSYPKEFYEDMYTEDSNIKIDPDPDAEQKSALTIYCDATEQLPVNPLREKIANQDNALKSGAKSEKMMASIYSICLFGMIFFTDNKIIKLTSARPSQNLDIVGFGFPRRMAVRFDAEFTKRNNFIGQITNWQAFHDPEFKHPYYEEKNGKKDYSKWFSEGTVDGNRWADAYFEGKFDTGKPTYLRLNVYDHSGYKKFSPNNLKLHEFDFEFQKDYRRSYSGRTYLINPQTGEREIQGGTMSEYTYDPRTKKVNYRMSNYKKQVHSLLLDGHGEMAPKQYNIISAYDIHYTDKPTALFLVAPPSTAGYNKVLLITVDMLYNQQVATGFLARSNQKPFIPTKYLFDEFGNMASDGNGIPDLDKKLTSGLGSEQQFTMVLQSMSQLAEIYGDKARKIFSSNVGTYFFMKSKDKELIQELMDYNGKKHVIQDTSVSFDKPAGGFHLFENAKNQQTPHVNTTTSRDERPVISENDYLRLTDEASDGNAIVSTGQDPIWSQGPTIMPMSYKLLAHRTGGKGGDIVPTALPTIADTTDFDPLQNLPDFDKMLAKRVDQAKLAPKVIKKYKEVNKVTDRDIMQMDPETYSNEIMAGIRENMRHNSKAANTGNLSDTQMHNNNEQNDNSFNHKFVNASVAAQKNYTDQAIAKADEKTDKFNSLRDQIRASIMQTVKTKHVQTSQMSTLDQVKTMGQKNEDFDEHVADGFMDKIYVNNRISKSQLLQNMPTKMANGKTSKAVANHALDDVFSMATTTMINSFNNDPNFYVKNNEVYFNNNKLAIELNPATNKDTSTDANEKYRPTDDFLIYLAGLDSWSNICGGRFEQAMDSALDEKEAEDNQYQN